jgi:hypothetical protein
MAMAQCSQLLSYDPNTEGITEGNRSSWWIRNCGTRPPYNQCLDKKGFKIIAATHLRCKPLNIIW